MIRKSQYVLSACMALLAVGCVESVVCDLNFINLVVIDASESDIRAGDILSFSAWKSFERDLDEEGLETNDVVLADAEGAKLDTEVDCDDDERFNCDNDILLEMYTPFDAGLIPSGFAWSRTASDISTAEFDVEFRELADGACSPSKWRGVATRIGNTRE